MAGVSARGPDPSLKKRFNPARTRRAGGSAAWSVLGHVSVALLTLVIAVSAVLGVLYVRLSHGPISIKYVASAIEKGINAELPGMTARMDDALLAVSPAGVIEFQLANLTLRDAEGDVVAQVPAAAVELSRPALMAFKFIPSRIDLINPQLYLFYSAEAGLSMSFAREGADGAAQARRALPAEAADSGASSVAKPRRVDLAAMINDATVRARQRLNTSSYLNQIGIRDALVTLDNQNVRSQWRVLQGSIEIDHSAPQSAISGRASIASDRGPWSITLHSQGAETGKNVSLEATVADLVPRTLGLAIPQLSLLETLNMPVSARAKLEVATGGRIASAALSLDLGRGQFLLPAVGDVPFSMDQGQISLTYDGGARRFDLAPSTLIWGTSNVSIHGNAVADEGKGPPGWIFNVATGAGQLAAEEFGVPPVAIEQGLLNGRITPSSGEARVDQLSFSAGGAAFASSGVFATATAAGAGGAKFDATLGVASAETLKVLWPRTLATGARTWVGERVKRGTLKSGTLHFVSGSFARDSGVAAGAPQQRRLSLAMEAADISAQPLRWMSPVEAPRALIRLEDNAIEITVPDAAVTVGPNRKIPIKAGRFASARLDIDPPIAEITFKALSPLVPVLEVLDQSPLKVLQGNGLTSEGLDGKVDGQMKLTLPLIADLDARAVKIEAKARVLDGKAKQLAGAFDVQGATVAIDVTEAAVGATGDMLVNGVPVKLGWQRILEETGEKQPPLRLSANLDNADRTQLGIDINHLVQGEVPVEVLIEKGPAGEPSVRLRADLTNADMGLESLAWRKPPGHVASLGADIIKGKVHKFELQNLKISGDDIAIEGWAGIGADNKLREVHLPGFSLNVITRLDVEAILRTEGASDKLGVWHVKVKGPNLDGRDMFHALFSVGPASDKSQKAPKPSAGVDIEAEIDNVIGHSEVSLHNVKLKMSRRADKMSFLEARGTLDGGAPVAISMTPEAGQSRRLLADTTDAGQAFKLIGFYPNMQAGRARLEVNVDGRGPAEKTGILWVEEFRVLGDPIVSEVLGSTPSTVPGEDGPRLSKKKAQQRETFDFDRMKVPFSVGYGQFVLEDAYVRGPLLGVNLRGKADFKLRSLNLGGTYIPLQGLNNAFGEVPLFGALVSGPKGDGAFGITFAVQGPMAKPEVLVNPLSIVAPGIFRELFQMTNPNPKVTPRDEKGPAQPAEKRVRASSSGAVEPERAKAAPNAVTPRAAGDPVDGWASQTDAPKSPARK